MGRTITYHQWNQSKTVLSIEIHGVSSNNDPKHFTNDETRAIKVLEATTKLKENCFEVGLLLKNDTPKLLTNKELGKRRLNRY